MSDDTNSGSKWKVNALSARQCESLKTGDRTKLVDGRGLYLEAMKTRKVWRFKSKLKNGTQVLLTLGEFPTMTLSQARNERERLRAMISIGEDPRKVAEQQEAASKNTLETVAQEWLHLRADKVTPITLKTLKRILEKDVFPVLGSRPVSEISVADVLELLRGIEVRAVTTCHLCRNILSKIFAYALRTEKCTTNPAASIIPSEDLKRHRIRSRKTIPLEELPNLMKAIENDICTIQARTAMVLMLMLFPRKMELCTAEWSHIDFQAGTWTIPAENMKKRREHVIPLPRQAMMLLRQLWAVTGQKKYVFATGTYHDDSPLGSTALNGMLTRMGFNRKMTVHGFRALAASWMDEQGFNRLAIERQLAHLEQGLTNQAYHRSDYMTERREMLQAWADYLDQLKADTTNTEESLEAVGKAA
jgi:integrase